MCNRCCASKPLSEFHKNAGTRDGFNYACKPCAIAVVMKSFQRHPETVHKARQRDYRSASQQARNQRKRMHRKGAPQNDFTVEQWGTIQERYSFCCAYCGRARRTLTQDHIMPLSKGGPNTASNIVPACGPVMVGKTTKWVLCRLSLCCFYQEENRHLWPSFQRKLLAESSVCWFGSLRGENSDVLSLPVSQNVSLLRRTGG